MDFVAIDVETADTDRSSICQIGVATFINGKLSGEWSTLVNPEVLFDDVLIGGHNITPEMVVEAPTFAEIYKELSNRAHSHFVGSKSHAGT